ncbi:hypothetical protein [Pedobacter sp. N23S346]|uniref:hypothetical protein n=1 Tax=Pedobacter sp. N23S346 TaxID=3402750 RepID=UPI003AD1AC27
MQLTKQQIEKLRIHLEESGFKYIDVQMEILDHVATAVEVRMTENVGLTFQDAVNQTHSSFGPKGFRQIEASIIKGITRKYRKLFLNQLLSFFSLKYISLVLFSCFLFYKIQQFFGNQDKFLTFVILGMMMVLVASLTSGLNTVNYKRYMLCKISGSYINYTGLFLVLIFQSITTPLKVHLDGVNASFLFTSFAITLYGLYYISAVRIAKQGIFESKQLLEKFQLMNHKTKKI